MSICLGVLWSAVCLQVCFKNLSFPPKQLVPPNRISTGFLSSHPCGNAQHSLTVQPSSSSRSANCRLAGRDHPTPSCHVWVSSSTCCSQLQLQQCFPENKGEEFLHIVVVQWWLEYKQREGIITVLFFSWLSPLSLNTGLFLTLSQIHTSVHETCNYFS